MQSCLSVFLIPCAVQFVITKSLQCEQFRRGVVAAPWFSGNDVSIQPLEGSGLAGTEEVAETPGAYIHLMRTLPWQCRSLRVSAIFCGCHLAEEACAVERRRKSQQGQPMFAKLFRRRERFLWGYGVGMDGLPR